MPFYRKKPIVIEAFRYFIDPRPEWFDDSVTKNITLTTISNPSYCEIKTLEGVMRGIHGDWIIKGINGEIYPCTPDIFEKTYELVEE